MKHSSSFAAHLFLFAFIWLNSSIAQPYIPMLGEANEWRVVSCFNGCVTSAYYTAGDTVVGNQGYRVLDGYHYINGNMLLREDTQERKVYLKQTFGHSLLPEFTLYDFSLEVGDTVSVYNPISPLPENGGEFVLDSIIFRSLEAAAHRFFYLHAVNPGQSNSTNTVWVEGIGALSLINSPGAMPTEAEHMVCAMKDGELIYADLDSIFSCGPLNNAEELKSTNELNVYPNPTADVLNLNFDGKDNPQWVCLYDFNGKVLFLEEWSTELDLQSVSEGFYLLKVGFENGSHINRRISVID